VVLRARRRRCTPVLDGSGTMHRCGAPRRANPLATAERIGRSTNVLMVSKRALSAIVALGLCCGCSADGGGGPDTPGGSGGSSDSGGAPSGGGAAGAAGNGSAGTDSGGNGAAGSTGGGGPSNPISSAAVPSAGCDQAPEFQSGTQEIEVGGLSRTFIIDLPGDYAQSQPYPLVFGFHGRGFSAAEFRSPSYGNLLSVAGNEAIVVHPEADGDALAWETESQEDVVFFDALLEALSRGLCVDESRVFAAGHSSGGYFANLLGCQRGDVLRAIAPVAGGGPFGQTGGAPSCERPVSAWIAHAEDDETVLFANGEGSLDYWLGSDDCDAESFEPVQPDPCVAYRGCASGLAVRWCAYEGGHDWPSFAAEGIWEFFESF
jgi:polyhydroxybutyrate depolymerase